MRDGRSITFNGAQPLGPSKEEIHDGGGFVKLELVGCGWMEACRRSRFDFVNSAHLSLSSSSERYLERYLHIVPASRYICLLVSRDCTGLYAIAADNQIRQTTTFLAETKTNETLHMKNQTKVR